MAWRSTRRSAGRVLRRAQHSKGQPAHSLRCLATSQQAASHFHCRSQSTAQPNVRAQSANSARSGQSAKTDSDFQEKRTIGSGSWHEEICLLAAQDKPQLALQLLHHIQYHQQLDRQGSEDSHSACSAQEPTAIDFAAPGASSSLISRQTAILEAAYAQHELGKISMKQFKKSSAFDELRVSTSLSKTQIKKWITRQQMADPCSRAPVAISSPSSLSAPSTIVAAAFPIPSTPLTTSVPPENPQPRPSIFPQSPVPSKASSYAYSATIVSLLLLFL